MIQKNIQWQSQKFKTRCAQTVKFLLLCIFFVSSDIKIPVDALQSGSIWNIDSEKFKWFAAAEEAEPRGFC